MRERIEQSMQSQDRLTWDKAVSVEDCEQIIRDNTQALDEWLAKHKPIVVMCPPTYFRVDAGNGESDDVAGNGFVKAGFKAFEANHDENYKLMQREWLSFQNLLREKGADIICMEPHPDFPDEVFTADHSFSCVFVTRKNNELVSTKAKTVISKLAHPNRLTEHLEVEKFFAELKQRPDTRHLFSHREVMQADADFEGVGENLLDASRGIILSGYGFRNAKDASLKLQKITGLPGYSLENKMPFFHLDTYCAVLPGGYVLYAPEVMHEHTVSALEKVMFKGHQALKDKYGIIVSKEDAYQFACNAVIIGKHIVIQECSEKLKEVFLGKGLDVSYINAMIARYAGGGLHCMTNMINQAVIV